MTVRATMQVGLAARTGGLPQGAIDLVHVVAVRLDYVPSVGKIVLDDIDGHDHVGRSTYLDAVDVDDDGDVGKAEFLREPSRFGDLPLCLLAVAHERVDVEIFMSDPAREREAAAGRETLSEVPRRPVDEGDAPHHVSFKGLRAFLKNETTSSTGRWPSRARLA